jgi:hypothetical protein
MFGQDLLFHPDVESPEPAARAGQVVMLLSSERDGFLSEASSFGIGGSIVPLSLLDVRHLDEDGSPSGDPSFVNSARLSPTMMESVLLRSDPNMADIQSSGFEPHANAPSMIPDGMDPALFYDPRGDALSTPWGGVSIGILEEQYLALLRTSESVAHPYDRALLYGLSCLVGKMADGVYDDEGGQSD